MLTNVQVQTLGDDLLELTLEDVQLGYILTNIEGLDPVKAQVVSTDFAQLDGVQYQASYLGSRDVKFTIELEPFDYTISVSELRSQLYKFFLPKTPVTLTFSDTTRPTVYIKGVVEEFSTEIFSKVPTVNVTVFCADPDFKELLESTVTGVSGSLSYPFTYTGNVPTGSVLTILCSADNNGLTVYHGATGTPTYTFQLDYPFLTNDIITISSVAGNKYVTLTRNGVTSSIVYTITTGAIWPKALPGTNNIQVQQTTPGSSFNMVWTARHGGL